MEIKWNDSSCENMNVRKNGEVVYLTFPALERETAVYHGFSTRFGGVSEGIYHSMNLSFTRGDQEEAVKENFCRISSAIGFPSESFKMLFG